MKGPRSLEKLRDRVEIASRELKRLREENMALAARINELESRTFGTTGGTVISFEENPEVLRRKVNNLVDAIDRYLQNEEGETQ